MERICLRQRDVFSYICDILGVCSIGLLARTCKSFSAFIEARRDHQAGWPFVPRPTTACWNLDEGYSLNAFMVTDSFSVSRHFSPFSDYQHHLFYPSVVRQCAPSTCAFYHSAQAEKFTVPDGPEMVSVETQGLVGRVKSTFRMACMISAFPPKDSYVGDELLGKRSLSTLCIKDQYQFANGRIAFNWNDWERCLHHSTYNVLFLAPEEHFQMYVIPPLLGGEDISKITEHFYCSPALCFINEGVASLVHAVDQNLITRNTNCLIVSIKDDHSYVLPIINHRPVFAAIQFFPTMKSITEKLLLELLQSGVKIQTSDWAGVTVDSVLECFVNEEQKTKELYPRKTVKITWSTSAYEELKYELEVSGEPLYASEILFQATDDLQSLPEAIKASLSHCPENFREELKQHILLTHYAGTLSEIYIVGLIKNLGARLENEIPLSKSFALPVDSALRGAATVAALRVDWCPPRPKLPDDSSQEFNQAFTDIHKKKYTSFDMSIVPPTAQPFFTPTPVIGKEDYDWTGPSLAFWPIFPWHDYIRKY